MNNVADSVFADKADLSEVLSWLYELINRSTSAECGFAASSRAKATVSVCEQSVLQVDHLITSRGLVSLDAFPGKCPQTSLYDDANSLSDMSGISALWHSRKLTDCRSYFGYYLPIYIVMAPVPWTHSPEFVWKTRLVNLPLRLEQLRNICFHWHSLCTFDRRCYSVNRPTRWPVPGKKLPVKKHRATVVLWNEINTYSG